MKKKFQLFILAFFIICSGTKAYTQTSTAEKAHSYIDFKELKEFREFEKISDTSFYASGYDPTHRVTHLRKGDRTVILFSKISLNEQRQERYTLLDTIDISSPNQPLHISIGYCYRDDLDEELVIAIVESTTKQNIQNLEKAWKADTATQQIMEIEQLSGIECFNELYTGAIHLGKKSRN